MKELPNVYYMKVQDSMPALVITLRDENGDPIDLTDVLDVKIFVAPCVGGRLTVAGESMSIEGDPSLGVVKYQWKLTDTQNPGTFKMEYTIIYDINGADAFRTVPRSDYDTLIVIPHL